MKFPGADATLSRLLAGEAPQSQGQARALWTHLHARWVLSMEARGYVLTEGEHFVGQTDARDGDHDGPHKAGGAHYLGTGGDDNLFVGWRWIDRTDHPAWQEGGRLWKALHPSCRWGGDFSIPDGNHLSVWWANRA